MNYSFKSLSVTLFLIWIFSSCSAADSGKYRDMEKVKVGSTIPLFELKDQNGDLFKLSSLVGKRNIVLFFYPKDDTPGCTAQACAFRDQFDIFEEAGASIVGVSSQSVESHHKFASKYSLNYTILSDEGGDVRKLFGVPNSLFGLIPGRVTYIIDIYGKVLYIFNSQTNVERHIDESLRILQSIR